MTVFHVTIPLRSRIHQSIVAVVSAEVMRLCFYPCQFVRLSDRQITQKVMNACGRNFLEGWDVAQGTVDLILVVTRIMIGVLDFLTDSLFSIWIPINSTEHKTKIGGAAEVRTLECFSVFIL